MVKFYSHFLLFFSCALIFSVTRLQLPHFSSPPSFVSDSVPSSYANGFFFSSKLFSSLSTSFTTPFLATFLLLFLFPRFHLIFATFSACTNLFLYSQPPSPYFFLLTAPQPSVAVVATYSSSQRPLWAAYIGAGLVDRLRAPAATHGPQCRSLCAGSSGLKGRKCALFPARVGGLMLP